MQIDIEKYASYFHDGDLREIQHEGNHTILVMESAQLRPEWNEDNISLSNFQTISGRLHLLNIKCVKENDKIIDSFVIKDSFSVGNIHRFIVNRNSVVLMIWWIRYPYEESDTYKYEIEAEEIFWENIPSLSDEH